MPQPLKVPSQTTCQLTAKNIEQLIEEGSTSLSVSAWAFEQQTWSGASSTAIWATQT
jgi:hypothetical protein